MEFREGLCCHRIAQKCVDSALKTFLLVCFFLLSFLFHFKEINLMYNLDNKSKDLAISLRQRVKNSVQYGDLSNEITEVNAGDVDVAIFTIRDNRIPLLPRKVYCPTWNNSIIFRNARFNVTECKNADVVMFTYGKGFERYEYWQELQEQRSTRQLWLMSTAEAAINVIPVWPPLYMRYIQFNLSSTFRSDSELPIPYGTFTPFEHPVNVPFRAKELTDKENLIVWVASHCPLRTWNRTGFVHDLSRFLPVDIYGKCGPLRCDEFDKRCFSTFRSYMFYLSLENSCCDEYITEKFWEPLMKYEAIPVVMGTSREDYERVAPPHSFIHADDFNSVKDLADYINTVASNISLYRSYFEWKNHGYVQTHKIYKSVWESDKHACQLLDYVHRRRPVKTKGFDPYGQSWFRSCKVCGTHRWLQSYYFYPYQHIYDRLTMQEKQSSQ